jgi:antitoxin (DNA-binding transcriptional repressor) of toxin-antitoxin stability system
MEHTRVVKSQDARANWSSILRSAEAGDTVVIEHYSRPVARLVPVTSNPMASPLATSLLGVVEHLAGHGRRLAAELRTAPLDRVPEYAARLGDTERHLARVIRAVSVEQAEDAGVVHLGAYASAGEDAAAVAERWARIACRDHSWTGLVGARLGDVDGVARALTIANVEPERTWWAPGLTQDEAERVCAALDIPIPEPLVDVDDRIAEAARQRGDTLND